MSDNSATAAHRRGWWASGLLVLVIACTACSSGGSTGSSSSGVVTLAPASTTASGAATVPASVEVGTGVLTLGPNAVPFAVTGCALTPVFDADGVALVAEVTGTEAQGGTIDVTRKTTAGDKAPPTTTDTISYTTATGSVVSAQRFEVGGAVHDLRDPAATGPLLSVDGTTVRGSGLFGVPGAVAGGAELVHGDLVVACAADALVPPVATDSSSS